ncbi:MAG: hypothetical protein F9K24_09875 [Leptonema illini]|uniref:Uncharacterized protein n=1 Tax=Leptonema illini TaxID=183 RepID=A0A833H1N9_9LEPT|nr:MAG: hypothetical protein F9K24_09875 [Leptonema illini]PKL30130.1 MAG: hypothetical protein CVV45_19100 [Spirochaetae bacterium HGW-Spirochaetae-10]
MTFQINRFLAVVSLSLVGALPACSTENKPDAAIVGADRDEHGCIPSAGYTWCKSEAACVRPFELARAKGFAQTPEALERYCNGK